jgi:uncharacterized protein YdaU (DUF1376 family)
MSAAPWMPLYVADYLGDTQHLTTEQHGAYLLILMTLWRQGGRIPAEPAQLARIAGVGAQKWAALAKVLMPLLTVEDGFISQKRLLREHAKSTATSGRRNAAARIAATAKAGKKRNAATTPRQPIDDPTQGISESESHPDLTPSGLRPDGIRAREPEGFAAFWEAYPHKVGRPRAAAAFAAALEHADADAILAGLRRYVAEKPADRPWLNPATFLGEQRWADQPAAVEPGRGRGESVGDMIRSSLGRLREG